MSSARADGSSDPKEASLSGSIRTLTSAYRWEIRIEGSRFIAFAWPVSDEQAVGVCLQSLHREHRDATHHCWAYRIVTNQGERQRSHDAGEPAGTAGAPILQAIHGAGLGDVLVGVARYFGGTKLGKGGLARAYRTAAKGALEGAPQIETVPQTGLRVAGPIEKDGAVRHLVARHGGTVTVSEYENTGEAVLSVRIASADVPSFTKNLDDLTRGTWSVERDE